MMGIVIIGRNEGARLGRCLDSVVDMELPMVYVDSGSSDGSVTLAAARGIEVVELEEGLPLSAARARREGFRHIVTRHPNLEFVFFVDGDCEVVATWPSVALAFLWEHQDVGAVCGRRREQHPEQSVYNRLCDNEWNTPVGESLSVGGDAIYRCDAYCEAGEFDPGVPAGEEPELCKRIRDKGWKIWRLDAEMTLHDAAMTRLRQWWKRQIRTGYSGLDVERRFGIGVFDRIVKSAGFWGLLFPLVTGLTVFILAWRVSGAWAIAATVIAGIVGVLQMVRIAWRTKARGYRWMESAETGLFTMAAKLPILIGAVRLTIENLLGRQSRLIEYKTPDGTGSRSHAPRRSVGERLVRDPD